jgi:hypothetical protein
MGGSPMISTSIFVTLAILLVVLLLMITGRDEPDEQAHAGSTGRPGGNCDHALQRSELVIRIFSPQDREFILLFRSPQLRHIYRKERRMVALHWVRRTSREVRSIMRVHRLGSRQTQNLNVAAEARLVFQYLEFQFICALLAFLIRIFGPHALNDLAVYAGNLYRLIGHTLLDGAAATRVASAENPAGS